MAGSKRQRKAIASAVQAGKDYLLASATEGLWRGFPTLAGESESWVSGFVLTHLLRSGVSARALVENRRALAAQRQTSGGWGYGPHVPEDADSTAWCLMALDRSRLLTSDARSAARGRLAAHVLPGGVATYLGESGIRKFISAPANVAMEGWTQAHPDVTAAALLAGVAPRGSAAAEDLLTVIVQHQNPAGVLPSYWWRGPYYGAALALRAFVHHCRLPPARFVERLVDAIERKQLPDGGYGLGASLETNPFNSALALEAMCHVSAKISRGRRRRLASALLACRGEDGAWRGSPVLRIPAPNVRDPRHVPRWSVGGGGNSFFPDRGGLFATSLAIHALTLHAELEAGEYTGLVGDWRALEPSPHTFEGAVQVVAVEIPPELERCSVRVP